MLYICNGKILKDNQIIEGKAIVFSDKIEQIVDINSDVLNGLEKIDANGQFICAGFIDTHIHGYDKVDTMDGNENAIYTMADGVIKNGVTSFLPTTMSMSMESIKTALDMVRIAKSNQTSGAHILGVHMEGPYFNSIYKGAQNPQFIISPTKCDIDFVLSYKDVIKIITIAPEIEGAIEFIEAVSPEIAISIGHSGATFEQAKAGIDAGACHVTHLFNGMTPLHHREPGVVGAAFATDISCEVICDEIHIHPGLFEFLVKVKGEQKLVLVTDCMRAGGCIDGQYDLGGQAVNVQDGVARLDNGALAGSVLTMNKALFNILNNTLVPIETAIDYVTINPAKLIGVDGFKGTLDIGKDADIIVFNDNIEIDIAIVCGKVKRSPHF
ncbi:MAG: N-acetylglucosamine-6-phosphate deacetylase [Epulopiscium sp. Nele67-Bin002]|nr:MAG: N-acetylglucosamine-6-phosphate deacetylase [Epulopiscium sp. Nele67-Bin002]